MKHFNASYHYISAINMTEKKERTPNDQRSDIHNNTSEEWQAMNDNRSNQKNPEYQKAHGSKGKK